MHQLQCRKMLQKVTWSVFADVATNYDVFAYFFMIFVNKSVASVWLTVNRELSSSSIY